MLTGVLIGWLHNMLAMKGEFQPMLMNIIDMSHREMDHQTSLCLDCFSKPEQPTTYLNRPVLLSLEGRASLK